MILSRSKFAALLLGASLFAGCDEIHQDSGPVPTVLLPSGASVVADGSGELSYQAPQDGRLFVYDAGTQTVEAATRMRAGQRFVLSADGLARLDGQKLGQHDLKKTAQHRLYFEKE
ncbi:MAG TPA: hypothetical protein VHS31_07890 [Tepidisphaeraceae bacterium]|jgi:hypothetical protein|nr:hypothetical protein [Tepidisphaeraceae bacterium]